MQRWRQSGNERPAANCARARRSAAPDRTQPDAETRSGCDWDVGSMSAKYPAAPARQVNATHMNRECREHPEATTWQPS
jgi:hypothetical protein